MSVKERLKEFIKSQKMTITEFEVSINASNGYVNSISKGIGLDKMQTIIEKYPNLNTDWLQFNIGAMRRERAFEPAALSAISPKKIIPLIHSSEMAGYRLKDSQMLEYDSPHYIIPDFEDADFLVEVKGSSMQPKYNNGDILACKQLDALSFIQWGRVYVLCTSQGAIVKRLYETPNSEIIQCYSDNVEHYKPFELHKSEIRAASIVVGVIRLE